MMSDLCYPVHFSFDDGPHTVHTPKVLDVLGEEGISAAFFVKGERFAGGKTSNSTKRNYEILDRIKREGHIIGSHTYSHIRHPEYPFEKIRENIMKPNPLLKDYLSPVLRLPYGAGFYHSDNPDIQAKNDMVMNTVKEAGFTHAGWDIDSNDWNEEKRPGLLPELLKEIRRVKGGIVLFHDVHEYTVDHLREWIQAVKGEGHMFVPLTTFIPEADNPLPPEALSYS